MNKNGRNQNELVADLLTSLSEEVNRLRVENKNLQAEVDRLRLASPAHQDLRQFLDSVADLVATHPFAQTAPSYFAVTLAAARKRLT